MPVCNALGCADWHGTLCTSGWSACHECGRAWRVVEIDLLGPFFELGDHFSDRKLDAKYSTILVDFGLVFVTRIIALLLVSLE